MVFKKKIDGQEEREKEHLTFIFRSSKQISKLAHEDAHTVMPGIRFSFSYFFASLACLESLTLP